MNHPSGSTAVHLRHLPSLVTSRELRVQLDRDSLLDLDPVVTSSLGTAGVLAARVFPPWFFHDDRLVPHDDPRGGSRSMESLAQSTLVVLDARPLPVPPLAIVCYRLPNGVLVLDGNHRFLSLARFAPERVVSLITIEGPLEPRLLPDLRHWAV